MSSDDRRRCRPLSLCWYTRAGARVLRTYIFESSLSVKLRTILFSLESSVVKRRERERDVKTTEERKVELKKNLIKQWREKSSKNKVFYFFRLFSLVIRLRSRELWLVSFSSPHFFSLSLLTRRCVLRLHKKNKLCRHCENAKNFRLLHLSQHSQQRSNDDDDFPHTKDFSPYCVV